MAQPRQFVPLHNEGDVMNQQPVSDNSFVVVNQQPSGREVFPYSLKLKGIFVFSLLKCVVGSILFITGIVNVAVVKYDTMIAFGIWCGLTILANGIIGCVLKFKQNKCLIAAFLALSITSLIFDISMLSFYSVVLEYFVNVRGYYCYYRYSYYAVWTCNYYLSSEAKDLGIGITSFLLFLVICELACSIGSVVLSGKAYCKCCNTCDANDCCTCLGCCECSLAPLNAEQAEQRYAAPQYNNPNIQMTSVGPHGYERNPNQPTINIQGSQNNPCSSLVSFFISVPAYLFDGTGSTGLSAMNVKVEAVHLNQQGPDIAPDRHIVQNQGTTAVSDRQNPSPSTWQQLET